MLAQRDNEDVRSFEDHWLTRMERAAEKRGRQEGRQEGRQKGMQQLLLSLLEQRFGSVPDAVRRRVETLDSVDEIIRLAGRISSASSLEDLGLEG